MGFVLNVDVPALRRNFDSFYPVLSPFATPQIGILVLLNNTEILHLYNNLLID